MKFVTTILLILSFNKCYCLISAESLYLKTMIKAIDENAKVITISNNKKISCNHNINIKASRLLSLKDSDIFFKLGDGLNKYIKFFPEKTVEIPSLYEKPSINSHLQILKIVKENMMLLNPDNKNEYTERFYLYSTYLKNIQDIIETKSTKVRAIVINDSISDIFPNKKNIKKLNLHIHELKPSHINMIQKSIKQHSCIFIDNSIEDELVKIFRKEHYNIISINPHLTSNLENYYKDIVKKLDICISK